jgi:hypothetical protein
MRPVGLINRLLGAIVVSTWSCSLKNKYVNDSLKKVVSSHKFNILAGLSSIIALIGWVLETFVTWSGIGGVVGWIATTVIILMFFMTLMVLIVFARKHYVLEEEKRKNSLLLEHQHLNLQTLYHLRTALDGLQNLEKEVLNKMAGIDSKAVLETYIESKEKDAAAIFKKFSTKAVNNTYKLAKVYFTYKGIDVGDIRLTVKAIISDDKENLDNWLVKTVVRDADSWQKLDNDDQHKISSGTDHKIGENTDFHSIIDNKALMYCCNDLKELGPEYKNSSPSWTEHYNATQVVPISTLYKDSWLYFGFVALDSLNNNKNEMFVDSKDSELYQILKSLSEAIAIWHIVYNGYIHNIFKEHELIQKAREEFLDTDKTEGESK